MSRHYWNSVGERAALNEALEMYENRLEGDDSFSRSSSSSSSSSEDEQSLFSFEGGSSSSSCSLSDDDEDGDLEDMEIALVTEASRVYGPVAEDIDFDAPPLKIADLDPAVCVPEFRFRKEDLVRVSDGLWPRFREKGMQGDKESVRCSNRYRTPFETGFLMLLFRLSRPRRIRPDMERFFRTRKSKLSAIISTFVEVFYLVAFPYLNDPSLFYHRFPIYAERIRAKAQVAGIEVWGFIDGTVRKTCRPVRFQKQAYSGHKRCHGIKFQSVTTPDGLIACLFGPISGNRHDSYMLSESGLQDQLRTLMPEDSELYWSLYGDPAYPTTRLLFGGFRNPPAGSPEGAWNTRMSKVRETVEWMFKEIVRQWSFLDFKASMQLFKFPVAKYYVIGGFLTNLRCCLYSSETAHYFNFTTHDDGLMTLEEYLNLVPLN